MTRQYQNLRLVLLLNIDHWRVLSAGVWVEPDSSSPPHLDVREFTATGESALEPGVSSPPRGISIQWASY